MSERFKRTSLGSSDSNGGTFLKIEDNSSVTGVIRGNPLEFYQHWPQGGEKQIFDKPTPGASPRFRVNLIVYEEKKFVAKIWEYPPTVSNMIADIDESYNLDELKIKITKTRQGKKVSYMILPLAGDRDKLSEKFLKEINAVELIDLSLPTPSAKELKSYSSKANDDEVPF